MKTNLFLLLTLGLLATACNSTGFHLDISGTVTDLEGVPLEPQAGRQYNVCFTMKFQNKETGATKYLDEHSGNMLPATDYNCWNIDGTHATFSTSTDANPGQFNDDYNADEWNVIGITFSIAVIPPGINLDYDNPDPSNCKAYVSTDPNETPEWSGQGLSYTVSAEFTVDPEHLVRDLTPADFVYGHLPACR